MPRFKKDSHHDIIKRCAQISMIGAIYFSVSVFLLGFIEPGYNHFIDTISILALGKYGWIQTINFFVLSISAGFLGIALGLFFYRKFWNYITINFLFLSLCSVLIIFFKADPIDRIKIKLTTLNSPEGYIHFIGAFLMILFVSWVLWGIIKVFRTDILTHHLAQYTAWVTIINIVFGLLWYYCRRMGIGFEIKGLWQKGLALNILIWVITIGKWLSRSHL